MDTQLEKLIETVVKELKVNYQDVLLSVYLSEMIDNISKLEVCDKEKAIDYFISLTREQTPKLFVTPSQGEFDTTTAFRDRIAQNRLKCLIQRSL